jgi:hypothetical protein
MPVDVFLSVGHALTPEQEAFVDAVGVLLRSHGLAPRTVGRTDFADRQPLKRVAQVLMGCSGTIVVALERIHIREGSELLPSSVPGSLSDISLPTVWNQIEAAMAYCMDQPLLAIVQTGLRTEGLLEEGYDWYVKWLDLSPRSLDEAGFLNTFSAWKGNVIKYHAQRSAGLAAAGLRLPHLD